MYVFHKVLTPRNKNMRSKAPEIEMRLDQRPWTFASHVLSKPEGRRFVGAFLVGALLILAGALKSKGAELTPEVLKAWDSYVQSQVSEGFPGW